MEDYERTINNVIPNCEEFSKSLILKGNIRIIQIIHSGGNMSTTEKKSANKNRKAKRNALEIRNELWPDLEEGKTWDRLKNNGFITIPRTMPHLINIINDLSKTVAAKSAPAGKTYFALWCRSFDEAIVKVENEQLLASEAGYIGERSVSTLREHLRILRDLGFIESREGVLGEFQYILLINPYKAVAALQEKIQKKTLMAFRERALEIGAKLGDE
jgi:hypothetical protein